MKNPRILVFILSLSFLAVAGLSGQALADSRTWTDAGLDKLTSNVRNWNGLTLPVSGDGLVFPSGNAVLWDLAGVIPASISSNADLTLQQPLSLSGGLEVKAGALHLNGQSLNAGSLTVSGGQIDQGSSPITLSGNWNFSGGSATLAAGTVAFTGSAAKTITSGGQHFGNLLVNAGGATVAAVDDLAVDGTLTLAGGTLNVVNKKLTVQGGINMTGGTLSLDGGTLVLAGSTGRPLTVTGGGLIASDASTVNYNSIAGSIAVEPLAYPNLGLNGSASFSLSDNTSVKGTLVIGANSSLSLAGHGLDVPSGLIENSGVIGDGVIHCPARALAALAADGSPLTTLKNSSGSLVVKVEDRDLNRKGNAAENIPAVITLKTVGGDKEVVAVNETGPATGVFVTDSMVVHQGEAKTMNGQIEVGQSDIVFASYADPYDPSDVKTVQVAVALAGNVASGAPQIISGPQVGQFSSQNNGQEVVYAAHVTWATDQASSSAVAVASPSLTAPLAAGSLSGVTSHDVVVNGLKRGVLYAVTVSSMTADGKSVAAKPLNFTVIVPGDRIKSAASAAVYWYLNDKRNVFSDFTSYDSWFPDFKGVIIIPADQMSSIGLGKNVPVRAGTYLIKIQSDPRVYLIEPPGRLRWLPTEAQALALYGSGWSKRVRDVDVSQFVNYTMGTALGNGEIPEGFVYQIAGGEWNVVTGHVGHVIAETSKKINGLNSRFVSSVTPAAVAALGSGGAVLGYESGIDSVFVDGQATINAPAFGN